MSEVLTIVLPLRTVSATNSRDAHWSQRASRVRRERVTTRACWLEAKGRALEPGETAVVTLTRVAPRPLDAHDNLMAACKGPADELAACLGLDRKDNSPRLNWVYAQRRGKPREYVVEVRVEYSGGAR